MTQAKIKVKRAELIKVVETRLRKLETENRRAKGAYPQKLEAWRQSAADLLERKARELRAGKTVTNSYGRITLPDQPSQPDGHRERCQLERTLKTLKIGADESILLSPEDADHYFGPCKTER